MTKNPPLTHLNRQWATNSFQAKTIQNKGQSQPFSELLPWLFSVNQQIIVGKDGSLMACFEFTSLDSDSSTDDQINHLSEQVEVAMRVFSQQPVMYWWQVQRRISQDWPKGQFVNHAASVIDELRREQMKATRQYQNRHYLSVLLLPPLANASLQQRLNQVIRTQKGLSILVDVAKETVKSFLPGTAQYAYQNDELSKQLVAFEASLTNFQNTLHSVKMVRLTNHSLRAYLTQSCSVNYQNQNLPLPQEADFAYQWLDEQLSQNELTVLDDEEYLAWTSQLASSEHTQLYSSIQTVKGWQSSAYEDDGKIKNGTYPGALDQLLQVDGELVATIVVKPMLPNKAEKYALSVRKYHNDRLLGMKQLFLGAFNPDKLDTAPVNTARAKAAQEANTVHGLISMGQMQLTHTFISVQSIASTIADLAQLNKKVEQALLHAKMTVSLEKMHALSGALAHIPGNYQEIIRWYPCTSSNVADLVPVRTIFSGSLKSPHLSRELRQPCDAALVLPTNYKTAYFYDVFAPIVGHGMLVGPTRAGKTVMAMLIASSFTRYPNAQIFCLDKDFSCRNTVITHGGDYTNLNPDAENALQMNPFELVAETKHHRWLIEFVILLAQQRGYEVDPLDVREIENAIASLHQLDAHFHTLSNFYGHITREKLSENLRVWVRKENGSLARYFDNLGDGFKLSQFTGFELGKILEQKQVAAPFTELLFYKINQHLSNQIDQGYVTPTMIFIPEAWMLLSNPVYASKLVDWLKTLAKRNCALWLDTQSLEDTNEDMKTLFATLRDNIKNWIFVPNSSVNSESAKRLYMREFGLSEEQIALIAQGRPRRDYLLKQEVNGVNIMRMVQLELTAKELACLRSDTNAQITLNKYIATHLPVQEWLNDFMEEMSRG